MMEQDTGEFSDDVSGTGSGCGSEGNDEETFGADADAEQQSASDTEFQCEICKGKLNNPRVLACLHVFCLQCLQKLLDEANETVETSDDIVCPSCSHVTPVKGRSAKSLLVAFVNGNILDMEAVRALTVVCTSCKSEDAAVARCADCANFLCPSCNQAHQAMRCFENHHVHSLEELKESPSPIPIHKPVMCGQHPSETIKFFCTQCQVPACSDCVTEHAQAEHPYERVDSAEKQVREELVALMERVRTRIENTDEASGAIMAALADLETNHDQAKELINETYQSYKAVLEAERDLQLERLTAMHNDRELQVMEAVAALEMSRPQMDMAVAFTNALIELGDSAEIVVSHGVVRDRLKNLLSPPLQPKLQVDIEFQSDYEEFRAAVKKHFGRFKSDVEAEEKASPPSSPVARSNTSMLVMSHGGKENPTSGSMLSGDSAALSLLGSTMSIPTSGIVSSEGGSSPTSLKSCDSDLSALSSPFNIHAGLDGIGITTPPLTQESATPSLSGLSMISECNLQRLLDLNMDPTPPPVQNTPFMFDLPNLLSTNDSLSSLGNGVNHAINNLQALAKLNGSNDVSHGQNILDNGHWPNRTSPLPDMGHMPSAYQNMNGMNGHMNGPMNAMNGLNGPMNGLNGQMNGLNGQMNGLNSHQTGLNGHMNGLHGMNPHMNGQMDYGHSMMRGRMMGQMQGYNGSSGTSAASQAMAAINSMNSHPAPRHASNNTTSMQVLYKYGQLGTGKVQFNSPHGFCLGVDEEVVVADTNNHRIQIFNKDGSYKSEFGVAGRDEGQLFYPRKVAVIKSTGKFVVCDRGNERSRMQIFSKSGHFMRKISIRYIDIVAGLAVTPEGYIVAVDSVSPTVFILNESGDLVRWFDCANYMREPSDIAVNGDDFYVCDFKGHCVVVFDKDGVFKKRIGQEGITNFPNGIDVSDHGDVLVGDSHGNRFHVTVFNRDGQHVSDVECPYVKVSRCCGLKLTREGNIVTLAKNNHHVLVLSTIFIP